MTMARRLKQFWARFRRNRAAVVGLVIICFVGVIAIMAPILFAEDPLYIVAPPDLWPLEDPSYPLGTDSIGRDIASIIFHGARTTLAIGIVAALVASAVGIVVGGLSGYYGGWVDDVLMRFTEIFQSIPNMVLLLAVVALLGAQIEYIIVAIGLASWTSIARMVRAEFLSFREREFVLACRTIGMRPARIIFSQILPNALPPVIVMASLLVAGAVLFESALSFLGLSDPDVASWGRLIGEGRGSLRTAWYISGIPGIAILLTVLSLNLIGDGLNDALNPKLKDR
jgi:peptide/nickel transport system permease protein